VFLIGLIGELEEYPIFWVMLVLMSFNGFFQASNHPGIVSILGNWFSRK
jgi:sugar phosphate permease